MGRKRANRQPGRVTGKEGAIHLDDWLDGPEDDYIDFEDNPDYSCLLYTSPSPRDA